jgi:hypothetical protein
MAGETSAVVHWHATGTFTGSPIQGHPPDFYQISHYEAAGSW